MNARFVGFASLGAALLTASLAAAATPTAPATSALALPVVALDQPLFAPGPELAVFQTAGVPEVSMAGVHYRPRRSGWNNRSADSYGVTQVHVGFFDPDGDPSRQFLAGIRGGPMVDPHVQIGLGVDWAHMTDNTSSVTQRETGPGGVPIEVKRDLSRASTNFFPVMAFVQISADDNLSLVPYFGGAAGYQFLNLSADDFQTGDSFDATYGGWGWQVWGGAALPLSGRTRLTGEIFVNGAELGRDVDDPLTGGTYRETVKTDGVGARFGLAWGF